jgi:amidohydrolase
MERIYSKLIEKIDEQKAEIIGMSTSIHTAAELAFNEQQSSMLLAEALEKNGFVVQRGIGSLSTAFKATFSGKKSGPALAFLAEYDALPGIGHGCGHNLIGPASVFAAIALSKVLNEMETFEGDIIVLGTPAEETGGGKIIMIEEGVFDHINYSLMAHPSSVNEVGRKSRAITGIHIEYFGKSAHSSAPEFGINALKAVINTFVGIDMMSQTFPSGVNTNGIILNGGEADNIIPEYASCQFTVRAETKEDILIALDKIKEVVRASEILTGARSKVEIEPIYAQRLPNMSMELRFKQHMEYLGEEVSVANPSGKFGSSDIGNVSLIMPIIHAYFKIMEDAVNAHSRDFAEKAISPSAFKGMVKASKALAMLGADILTDGSFRSSVDEEYARNRSTQNR